MVSTINESAAIENFLADVQSSRAAILFGAGVSMVAPTGLPSGKEIKDLIVTNIAYRPFQQDLLNRLIGNRHYQEIVPEVLFQEIFPFIKEKIFKAYGILEIANSNHVHSTLAYLLNKLNIPLYTTNFDELVDKFLDTGKTVSHLHGYLKAPEQMGILITQIGSGIETDQQKTFLTETDCKTLYVYGYSGNDKDILTLLKGSDINNICWLMRDINDDWVLKNIAAIGNKPVSVFQSDLSTFFERVASALGIEHRDEVISPQLLRSQQEALLEQFRNAITLYQSFACLDILLYINSDYEGACEACRQALSHAATMEEHEKLRLILSLADNLRTIGKGLQEGIELIDGAMTVDTVNDHLELKGNLLNVKGLLLHGLQDRSGQIPLVYQQALMAFKKERSGLKKKGVSYKSIDDACSRVYNNIGLYFTEIEKDYASARKFYLKSLALKRSIGHLIGECRVLGNLCIVELALGNIRSFRLRQKAALVLTDKYNLFRIKSELYYKSGVHFCEAGDTTHGLELLNRALQIHQNDFSSETAEMDIIRESILKYT